MTTMTMMMTHQNGFSCEGEVCTDGDTGLVWQKEPTGDYMVWEDAQAHCDALSLDGFDDWRLPSISELRTLIRGCPETKSDGSCGVDR